MTRLTGTFLLSLALCAVVTVAVAGSYGDLRPRAAEQTNTVTIELLNPEASVGMAPTIIPRIPRLIEAAQDSSILSSNESVTRLGIDTNSSAPTRVQ